MKTYQVKGTIQLTIVDDIYANSKEEAIKEFEEHTLKPLITDDILVYDVLKEVETKVISQTFGIITSKVDYDIDYNVAWNAVRKEHPDFDINSEEFEELVNLKMNEIEMSLPQKLSFTVTCNKDDLDDYVTDKIGDITGYDVNDVEYKII